jgi:hypothetical protein
MKIQQSSVSMTARSEQFRQHTVTESLRRWTGQEPPGNRENNLKQPLPGSIRLALSAAGYEQMRADMAKASAASLEGTGATQVDGPSDTPVLTDKDMAKIKLIEDFVYVLTGKRLKIHVPRLDPQQDTRQQVQQVQAQAVQTGEGPRRLGWGLDYSFHERIVESEAVHFATQGSVTTADGRQLDFSMSFSMSREFISETHLSIKAGDALVDPLVLNFHAAAATLGERSFRFDLDMDGVADTISFVGEGSGFLALDNNNNGTIDDGSELFGPQTGNGFSELAAHDEDGNGWIDENDPVFDRLRIWSMDGDGNLKLEALGKSGVGAIYLGNVTTPFRLVGADGQANGQIARSGVYLKENGTAATIQHVDLHI